MNHVPGNAGPDGWYDEDEPRRRRAGYVAWALVSVVVVAAAGFALVWSAWPRTQNSASTHPGAPREQASTAGLHSTAPPPQQNNAGFHTTAQSPSEAAEQVTAAFLRAWSSGAVGTAASLTDDPAAAQAALIAYGQDLYLRQLSRDRGQQHHRERAGVARWHAGGRGDHRRGGELQRPRGGGGLGGGQRPVGHLVLPVGADRVPGGGRNRLAYQVGSQRGRAEPCRRPAPGHRPGAADGHLRHRQRG